MALQLLGKAAVTAFLQSVHADLDAILGMRHTTPLLNAFNPELEILRVNLFWFQNLLVDSETRSFAEESVDEWIVDLKDLVYDVNGILDDINCGSTQPGNVQVSLDLSHITIKDRLCRVLVRTARLREEAEHLNLRGGFGSVPWGQSQPIRHRPETSPSIDMSEIHGREEDIKKIVDMLLEVNGSTRENYDVICIVGMGGLGKTTLAQLLYRDKEVARLFDVKSWACISDVFDVARATKELIENSRQSGGAHSLQSLAALQDELERIVENKRILFVLDDVWTAGEWDKMKAPLSSCAKGSKILVTTRIDRVALDMSNNRSPYRLGGLDYYPCWAIFIDKAFGEIDVDDVDQELQKLGQEIVRKCGGVPLAVKVIGSMLRRAKVERWKAVFNSLWNAAYKEADPSIMALQLVGEAAVAAFLQSVLRDLAAILARGNTTFVDDFNPKLKILEEKLFSFLDLLFDGETRRHFEKDVDKWMDDLKDLVYDVDDILDDINCGSTQPGNVQVSDDLSHVYGSLNTIKGRLGKVLVRTDQLREEAEHDLNLRRGIRSVPWRLSQPIRHRPETSPSVGKSKIHGREEDIKKIVDMLLRANGSTRKNYDVICIVGMGGLGKTTLAKLVFDHQEVERHFAVKSWACISDDFDVTRVTKELLKFSGQADGTYELKSLAALQKRLEKIVENKKILLVLDDVWTATEWDKMKAPLNSCANGSKLLVTTRIDKVALVMSNNRSPYHLGMLDHEQCWAIFKDQAFGEIDVDDVDQELRKLGQEIVGKCGGVPLEVKVLGSMLQGAEVERWKAVLENSLWNAAYEDDEILPAMRLSYHYLPACLKRCFEYFAVFPSDYEFDQDQLVRMWIAEGLVEEVEGRIAEDIGIEYYNDLKGRSLIQEDDIMHNIIHRLSCMMSKKFCCRANSCEPHASMRHASFVRCSDKVVNYGFFC